MQGHAKYNVYMCCNVHTISFLFQINDNVHCTNFVFFKTFVMITAFIYIYTLFKGAESQILLKRQFFYI